MKKQIIRILFGGAGGQGILSLGKVLSYAGIKRGLQVSCLAAYGAEMRGGYVYCTVILSTGKDIFSPVTSFADIGIFMNERSIRMLSDYLKDTSYVILNSSLIKNFPQDKFKTYEIEATNIAEKMGDIRVSNMVIGAAALYICQQRFSLFEPEDLNFGISRVISGKKAQELAKKAAAIGWNKAEQTWKT